MVLLAIKFTKIASNNASKTVFLSIKQFLRYNFVILNSKAMDMNFSLLKCIRARMFELVCFVFFEHYIYLMLPIVASARL